MLLASIARLLDATCPSAIGAFVGAVYVDAVNGGLPKWLWPHVAKKGLKRLVPFLAYTNAATAVIAVVWSVAIGASHAHVHPATVFGAHSAAPCIAMNETALGCDFSEPTSTALGLTRPQRVTVNSFAELSAIATAAPMRLDVVGVRATENGQSVKLETRQIN